MARKYGDQSFKKGEKDNLDDEMADVLWVLLCLANPVSYTHLDVYKRQVFAFLVVPFVVCGSHRLALVCIADAHVLAPCILGAVPFPVSYTHLDVYKRQPCYHVHGKAGYRSGGEHDFRLSAGRYIPLL